MAGFKCAKYFTVFLNTLVFLIGGLCLVSGLLFKLESGVLDTEVVALFNRVLYNNIPLGFVMEALAYIMMGFGFITMCVAVVGICGAWKHKRSCLIGFIICIVFMVLIQATLIGLWIVVRGRADTWLKGQMLDQLKSYAGPEATDDVSDGWNTLFMKGHCCGVNSQFENGGTNSDFTELPTSWTSATDKVPATCCQGVATTTITSYVNSASCTNTPKNFYTEGCYDTVAGYINIYSLITLVSCGTLILIEVLAIVSSCVVMESAKNKVSGIATGSKPPPYVAIMKEIFEESPFVDFRRDRNFYDKLVDGKTNTFLETDTHQTTPITNQSADREKVPGSTCVFFIIPVLFQVLLE